jgi:histidyl-tRNA synthetase
MEDIESKPDIYFITMGEDANVQACQIANNLRKDCGKTVILETLRRSMKAQMRDANRCGAKKVLILGDEELQKNIIIIKDMTTSEQLEIPILDIVNFISNH